MKRRLPLLKLRQESWAILLIFSAAIFFVLFALSLTRYFKVEISSTVHGTAQVFFDTGSGFNEIESSVSSVDNSGYYAHYFKLSDLHIHSLRVDPIDASGKILLRNPSIVNGLGMTLKEFSPAQLAPQWNLTSAVTGSVLEVQSESSDPMLVVPYGRSRLGELPLGRTLIVWMALTFAVVVLLALLQPLLSLNFLVNVLLLCAGVTAAAGACELSAKLFFALRKNLPTVALPDYPQTLRADGFGAGGMLKENFEALVADGYGGTVRWKNNSAGFRSDREFAELPPANTRRVLIVGDSFVAGYRVDQKQSLPALLERWAQEKLGPTEVLASVIEFPDKGLGYLKTQAMKWNPHVLILGITIGNDISQDFLARAGELGGFTSGLDRYELPDSSCTEPTASLNTYPFSPRGLVSSTILGERFHNLLQPPGAAIIAWYGSTSRPRLFDPLHGLGFFVKDPPQIVETAFQKHFEVLKDYAGFAAKNNLTFAAVVFPQRYQIQPRDWDAAKKAYHLREDSFDLLQPNNKIGAFCEANGITCVDPTSSMREEFASGRREFYFPRGDMHLNSAGYEAWFNGARNQLAKIFQAQH